MQTPFEDLHYITLLAQQEEMFLYLQALKMKRIALPIWGIRNKTQNASEVQSNAEVFSPHASWTIFWILYLFIFE